METLRLKFKKNETNDFVLPTLVYIQVLVLNKIVKLDNFFSIQITILMKI